MFDITTLTGFHTIMSLIAIAVGVPALIDLHKGRAASLAITVFLALAIGTSVTGYFFPFVGVTPAMIVGAIALVVLAVVLAARFRFGLAKPWRGVYAAGLVASEYLLVFVAVAQAFNKIARLAAAAPTQSEPPFLIAQGLIFALFVAIGVRTVRAFRGAQGAAAGGPAARPGPL